MNKVVDADRTNFRDLVDEVVDKYPTGFGDIGTVFYSCMDGKVNIKVSTDQDVLEIFGKHQDSKCCFLTFAYHNPSSERRLIPD